MATTSETPSTSRVRSDQLLAVTALKRQAGVGVEVGAGAHARREPAQAGGGDHRGVVGGERQARDERPACPRARPARRASARSRLLADTPPAMPTLRGAVPRAPRRTGGRAATRRRRAGSWRRGRPLPARRAATAPARLARSTWRSTAVFRPLKLKSSSPGQLRRVAVGVRDARHAAASIARSLPVLRQAIDRPARPDSPVRAAWPPCRTPRPPHRRASGRAAGSRRASAPDTGWCARRTRRARPPAAAARRSGGTSDSMCPAR